MFNRLSSVLWIGFSTARALAKSEEQNNKSWQAAFGSFAEKLLHLRHIDTGVDTLLKTMFIFGKFLPDPDTNILHTSETSKKSLVLGPTSYCYTH
jgi:hypothetical protein